MERASLRRVPSRPQGPVAPADALSYVTEELPGLDQAATAAFALVALVGRPRPELAGSADAGAAADLAPDALAEALARARKALRRKLHPLPGSGWCERAERLISDRLDDALVDPGRARLEVHLANCDRCVEHERRLGQAQETLVAGFENAHPAEPPASEVAPAEPEPESELPPALRVVDTPALASPSGPAALPAPDENAGELAPPHDEREPSTDIVAAPAAPAPPAAAPPPARPPRPAWIAPAPMAPVRPAHWIAPPSAPSPPPSTTAPAPGPSWPSTPRSYEAAWPAPALETRASRGAIEDDEWSSLAPLLAVLFAAIAVLGIAGLLAI